MKLKSLVILINIALIIGLLSGCVEEKPKEEANNAPVSSFTYAIDNFTVQFTDGSTDADEGDTLTYSWDFGDDLGTSTEANPTYTYAANGTYTVKLTVNDSTDEDSYEVDILIGNIAPTANFTYEATNLSVIFTDTSTDPNGDDIVGWSWDFGDGSEVNTTQNPTYTYNATGTYIVTLTVTDTEGETSEYEIEIAVIE